MPSIFTRVLNGIKLTSYLSLRKIVLPCLLSILFIQAANASTSTLTVSSTADSGAGSLRNQITAAHSDPATNITLNISSAFAPGTVTLLSSLPTINRANITLQTLGSATPLTLNGNGINGSITLPLAGGNFLTFRSESPDDMTFNIPITGTGTIRKTGSGTLYLNGNNSYTGSTLINAGRVVIDSDARLGAGANSVSLSGYATLNTTATMSSARAFSTGAGQAGAIDVNASTTFTLSGNFSGAGGLVKSGSGTLVLSGNNTYSGGTDFQAGILSINDAARLGTGSYNFKGGTLQATSTFTSPENSTLYASNPSNAVDVTGANAFTMSGNFVQNGAALAELTKTGTGTLILTGYVYAPTSRFTVNGGTLQIGDGASGARTYANSFVNNATLRFQGETGNFSNNVSGTGNVVINQVVGPTVFTGDFTHTGGTTISSITTFGNGGTTGSIAGNISLSSTLQFNRSDNITYAGVISGTGSVQHWGTGILTLTGDNTYTGTTSSVNAGTVQIGNGGTTGSVAGNISVLFGPVIFNRSNDLTYGGVITDNTHPITKLGTGKLILTGTSTSNSNVIISDGSVQLGNGGTTGIFGGTATFAVGLNTSLIINRSNNFTFANVISGSGAFEKQGTGILTLTGANTYSGGTTFTQGTLAIGSNGVLGNVAGPLTFNGGTLQVGGSFSTARNATVNSNNGTLEVTAGNSLTYNGSISGSGNLTKTGAGALVLATDNPITGTITIAAGTLSLGTGGTTGNVAGPIINNGILFFNRSTDFTISGVLSGTGAISKTGASVLTLSGTNTFTGGTTIANGTISVAADANLGAAAGTLTFSGGTLLTTATFSANRGVSLLAGGGTFNVAASTTFTNSGLVQGTTQLTKTGAGTLVLSGANTYSGSTAINAGTLSVSASNNLGDGSGTNSISMTNGTLQATATFTNARNVNIPAGTGTFDVTASNALTASGIISGNALAKTGAGSLILTGTNTYTGGTTVSAGTLEIGSGGAAGMITGNVAINGASSVLRFNRSDNIAYNDIISGTGSLNKSGTGTLTLGGANTHSGGTSLVQGILEVTADNNLGNAAGPLTFNGGTLRTIGGFTANRAVTLSAGGGTIETQTGNLIWSGNFTGTGSLTKTGAQSLTLSGTNNYTGATTINAGTLAVGSTTALSSASAVTLANVASAILDISGAGGSATIGSLSGGGATGGNVTLGANTLITGDAANTTYSGIISGTGGLTKQGSGVFTLNAANTYSGPTTITAGTLAVAATGSLANTSGFIVSAGANLDVSNKATPSIASATAAGTSNIRIGGQTLTLSSGTIDGNILDGGISGATGGVVTKNTAGTLALNGNNTYSGGTNHTGGTITINNNNSLGTGTLTVSGVSTIQTTAGVTLSNAITLNNFLNFSTNSFDSTLSGNITGAAGITKDNTSGTLTLSGNNSYTGSTNINGGTIVIASPTALPAGTRLTLASIAGANLNLTNITGGVTVGRLQGGGLLAGHINLGTNTITVGDALNGTYSGIISGTGGFIKQGTGTIILNGANTYSGPTTINVGTLSIGSTNALPSATAVTLANDASAILDISIAGGSVTIGSLAGGGATGGNVTLGANTITTGNATNTTYGGIISGTGGLTKQGSGTLTFIANQTYTGLTTVSAGTLEIGNNGLVGMIAGNVAVNGASSVLKFNRSDNIAYNNIISGTGSVNKSGGGSILTLGGANTYSGGTSLLQGILAITADNNLGDISGSLTLNGGALQIDANLSLARAATIAAGGGTIDTQNNNATYSGAISGSGALSKSGIGTFILTADNPFTGTLTVNAGTLQLGNGGTTGNVDGNIVNNADVAFNFTGTKTYNRVISGPGALTKQGTGTLIVAADQTYAGGTTVAAGTLQLGNGGTTGSVVGNITNNAAVTINRSGNLTYADVISGTGTVTKLGSGTLTYTADQTYTGVTTVSAGTLEIGNGGANGSIAGNLLNNGSVVFNRANNFAYNGNISGTGSLNKSGGGILTLGGNSTYTGATAILGGTLQLASATALPANTDLTLNGILDLNGNNATVNIFTGSGTAAIGASSLTVGAGNSNSTYSGQLTGAAGAVFNKNGTGRLAINTTNSPGYLGTINVNGGEANVNASLTNASITVGGGATLSGNHTFGTLTLQNGATLSPGNSIGTVNYTNFNSVAGSTTRIEIEPLVPPAGQKNDIINVTNNITLNGNFTPVTTTIIGYRPGDTYTFLNYGGVRVGGSTFVELPHMLFNYTLQYDDALREVRMRILSLKGLDLGNNADDGNTGTIGTHLDNLIKDNLVSPGSDLDTVLTIIVNLPTVADRNHALDQLSPAHLTRNAQSATFLGETVTNAASSQMRMMSRTKTLLKRIRRKKQLEEDEINSFISQLKPTSLTLSNAFKSFFTDKHNRQNDKFMNNHIANQTKLPQDLQFELGNLRLWFQETAKYQDIETKGRTVGLNSRMNVSTLGIDYAIDETTLIGGLAAMGSSTITYDNARGDGDVFSTYLGVYGSSYIMNSPAYIDATLLMGRHEIDSNRRIIFPGLDRTATQKHNALEGVAQAEIGYDFEIDPEMTVAPYATFRYSQLREQKYHETGAGDISIKTGRKTNQYLHHSYGLNVSLIQFFDEIIFCPSVRVGYLRKLSLGSTPKVTAGFNNYPGSFTVKGDMKDRNFVAMNLDLNIATKDGFSSSVGYNVEASTKAQSHEILLRFGWKF